MDDSAINEFRVELRVKNNCLVQRREELGMTQAQFARAVGLPQTTVSAWENLRLTPISKKGGWKDQAIRIANFHGVAPSELWPDCILQVETPRAVRTMAYDELRRLLPSQPEVLVADAEQNAQRRAILQKAIAELSPRETEVIRQRLEGKTLQVVADHLGMSREWVRVIHCQAVLKLRKHTSKQKTETE